MTDPKDEPVTYDIGKAFVLHLSDEDIRYTNETLNEFIKWANKIGIPGDARLAAYFHWLKKDKYYEALSALKRGDANALCSEAAPEDSGTVAQDP